MWYCENVKFPHFKVLFTHNFNVVLVLNCSRQKSNVSTFILGHVLQQIRQIKLVKKPFQFRMAVGIKNA